MEDLTGKQLGRYRVVGPLGEGGMAAVYKAYEPGLDRYVALKVLPRHLTTDPEFTGRFRQEAKLIARLQHVHILPVYDFGQEDEYTFIVMPFVQAGTLADVLDDHPLALPDILRIVSQIGDALGYAHDEGILHRDVKPSNILIDDRGNCLLTDFGIAKIVGATVQFTQTGAVIGTPAYMSPEQILGETLDGRSDLYSLGIILFQMATGRQPYRAETPPAIFVKHLHDPLPMPRELNPNLPEAVERVILKALAKNREERFSTAGKLVKALSDAVQRQIIAHEEPGPAETGPPPTIADERIDHAAPPMPAAGPSTPAEPAGPAPATAPGRGIRSWGCLLGGVAGLAGIAAVTGVVLLVINTLGNRAVGTELTPSPTLPPVSSPIVALPSPTDSQRPTLATTTAATPTPESAFQQLRTLEHDETGSTQPWIVCLCWSPDGASLAAGGTDQRLVIWDVETGEQRQVLHHSTWPDSCDWSPAGDRIAVGGVDSEIRIWDVSTGAKRVTLYGYFGEMQKLAWSPDGSTIAGLGSLDKSARTWDARTGEPLHALPSAEGTNDLDWSPDGTAIATSTGEGVKVWEAASGKLLYILDSAGATRSVRWSPDGLALMARGANGPAAWEIIGHQPIELPLPAGALSSPALWSPDGSMIAAGYSDGSLPVQDIRSGDRVLSSAAPWGSVVHLDWSRDSRFLAGYVRQFGGEDFLDWILLWDLDALGEPTVLKGHDGSVFQLEWSPTENLLASGAHDGTVILWGSPSSGN